MQRESHIACQKNITTRQPPNQAVLQHAISCGHHSRGAKCEVCKKKRLGLQHQAITETGPATVPPIVHEVLRTPRRPLNATTPVYMEPRFGNDFIQVWVRAGASPPVLARLSVGAPQDKLEKETEIIARQVTGNTITSSGTRYDFSKVQIHTDSKAAESAQAVGAYAYTVGNHIVFDQDQVSPETTRGRQLLAHELAHVFQQSQSSVSQGPRLSRFVRSERSQIGNLDEVVDTAEQVAEDRSALGMMHWGRFTAAMGGVEVIEAVAGAKSGSSASTPFPRYLYTYRCGLIDMRHFYQLMYIAVLRNEESAVEKGIEHEESAEPESSFAPEDITLNALVAEFGSQPSWFQRTSTFVSSLRTFLEQCMPVNDWHRLSYLQQNCVVKAYAVDGGGDRNRRRTVGTDSDPCWLCSGEQAFPLLQVQDHKHEFFKG
jgi:hypothetical protein